MTTTSRSPENSKEGRENSVVPLLASVIGSVAGTLVTTAVSTSPNMALLGAALGAAIPPLVAVVGPYSHLRLGAGVLIAGLALLLTYSGFTITEKAADKPTTTFPVPDAIARPTEPSDSPSASASPSPSASPTTEQATCEGDLCINWAPRRLQCSNGSCASEVTVWSEGSEQLVVTSLEFTGDAADRLSQEGTCDVNGDDKSLDEGEPCVITIRVEPGDPGTAQLVIHQNLKGPPSLVDIDVDVVTSPSAPAGSLDLLLTAVSRCLVVPQASENIDRLKIFPRIQHLGPLELSQPVPIRISSDTGLVGAADIALDNGVPTAVQIDLRPDDYGKPHLFTITIDPDGVIPERDESNNTLDVSLSLPSAGGQPQELPC